MRRHIIEERGRALEQAQAQTGALLNLFDTAKGLRRALRGLDRFLTGVMESAIAPGQEAFSDFLIALVHDFSGVAKEHAHALELYIALSYGDGRTPRSLTYEFAATHGLFAEELAVLREESERKTRDERTRFQQTYIEERVKWKAESRQQEREDKRRLERERELGSIINGKTGFIGRKGGLWYPPTVYSEFVWWKRVSYIQKPPPAS